MSESKRSIPEIQQEYQNLCLKAGHVQYQLFTNQKDLELLNGELRKLNLEAAAVKAAQDSALAAVEAPAEVPAAQA